MKKFYYTFGSHENFPFYGGWVEVAADNITEAHRKFRAHFPDVDEGILNCSDYYTESQFFAAGFKATGNRGKFCHKVIE